VCRLKHSALVQNDVSSVQFGCLHITLATAVETILTGMTLKSTYLRQGPTVPCNLVNPYPKSNSCITIIPQNVTVTQGWDLSPI